MTRLFVVSDTHECTGMLELAAQRAEEGEFDAVIHLGDVRRDAEWLEKRLNREIIGVPGNCDFFSRSPRTLTRRFEGVNTFITHGDLFGVKSSPDRLSYKAEEMKCALALFGHTHLQFSGRAGSVVMVNPGTVMNGRYAVIEIDGEKITPSLLIL